MNTNDELPEQLSGSTKSIGYGNPPEATRFKKGISGNPKGRPKGSLNVATAFMKTLREKVVINENGLRRKVTKLEAALKQLVNKAASGELRALRQLLELARDAEAKQGASGTQDSLLNDLDRQVMESVLQRFQLGQSDIPELEVEHVDDERG